MRSFAFAAKWQRGVPTRMAVAHVKSEVDYRQRRGFTPALWCDSSTISNIPHVFCRSGPELHVVLHNKQGNHYRNLFKSCLVACLTECLLVARVELGLLTQASTLYLPKSVTLPFTDPASPGSPLLQRGTPANGQQQRQSNTMADVQPQALDNPAMPDAANLLAVQKHIRYCLMHLQLLPTPYESEDCSR